MASMSKKAVWDAKIVRRAIVDSFVKLDPRHMMGNPVMFVVEIGSVITTVLLFRGGEAFKFNLQITLWLWFTVLVRQLRRGHGGGPRQSPGRHPAQSSLGDHRRTGF